MIRKQILRKKIVTESFFWCRHRLGIVGSNTFMIVVLRRYLGKFLGMTDNWRCMRSWLKKLLKVTVWKRIRPDRGFFVTFVSCACSVSSTKTTSWRSELFIYGDLILRIDLFLSYRHGIQNPDSNDYRGILHLLDAVHTPMPCYLPETD